MSAPRSEGSVLDTLQGSDRRAGRGTRLTAALADVGLDIRDETAPLEAVILGSAHDCGEPTRHNLTDSAYCASGQAPMEKDLVAEVEGFRSVLSDLGVQVVHPGNLPGTQQVFARDLAFVIGEKFFWGNLKRADRRAEREELRRTLAVLAPDLIAVEPPAHMLLEGGDIVLLDGKVFVGVGCTPGRRRTDPEAVGFLQSHLPDWEVIPLRTRASDEPGSGDDPRKHVLHLDCAFQPLGSGHAVIFEDGFSERPDAIFDSVGAGSLIKVSGEEMFQLGVNILSVSPDTVISTPGATRLNHQLREVGLTVLEVPYREVTKQGGAFRCSTLPLRRRYRDDKPPTA